ncbi:hypothetical protein GCM10028790_55960 [Micromonospora taraxaci]
MSGSLPHATAPLTGVDLRDSPASGVSRIHDKYIPEQAPKPTLTTAYIQLGSPTTSPAAMKGCTALCDPPYDRVPERLRNE